MRSAKIIISDQAITDKVWMMEINSKVQHKYGILIFYFRSF